MNRIAFKLPEAESRDLGKPLRVLLVEHSGSDAELCLQELKRAGVEVHCDIVQSREEFSERVRSSTYDIVLADYQLPQWAGMDALALLRQLGKEIPFLLVTGALGEEVAVDCIKQGVCDYIHKDRLTRLPLAVHRALAEKILRGERRRAEDALQEANERLAARVNELEQHTREITLVNQMVYLLHTCVAPEEAYTVIGQSAGKLFPADSGALCVLNGSRNLVEAVAVWGHSVPGEPVFASSECWALRRGQAHLVESPDSGPLCGHLSQPPPANSLCVPMMAQGKALGVLLLQSGPEDPGASPGPRNHLTKSQQRLALNLAEHIAPGLANLRLREALENLSVRDPLTGLFNRRYLEESLERELHRATRKQRPLGVIMLDLDHFKHFNDTYGHEAGDTLLRELGRFLQAHIRREDIACRYGGEEFILIMPEAWLDVTRERAEWLREEIKNLTVKFHGQVLGALTLSLGVAIFPQHAATASSLLRASDLALYRAKAEGRDRAVVSLAVQGQDQAPSAISLAGQPPGQSK